MGQIMGSVPVRFRCKKISIKTILGGHWIRQGKDPKVQGNLTYHEDRMQQVWHQPKSTLSTYQPKTPQRHHPKKGE